MKKLSLLAGASLSLVLVACPQPSTPETGISSVAGTVVEIDASSGATNPVGTRAWTGGAGTVSGVIGADTMTNGTLATNGTFNLNLPVPASSQLQAVGSGSDLTSDACSGSFVVSDPAAQGTDVTIFAKTNAVTAVIAPTVLSYVFDPNDPTAEPVSFTAQVGQLLYVDRPVTLSGTQTCTLSGKTFQEKANLTLSKGWNKVTVFEQKSKKASVISLTSGAFPTQNWIALPSGFQPQSLSTPRGHALPLFKRLLR